MGSSAHVAGALLPLLLVACGSGGGAPRGAVTDCGAIDYRGSALMDSAGSARLSGQCFVTAVQGCHAARLKLLYKGVDTGTREELTVRQGSHGACATAVAQTSFALTRTTHRHLLCHAVSVTDEGLALADCNPPL